MAQQFTLASRPAVVFDVVKFYKAAGFIPSVIGRTADGRYQTAARVVDVVFTASKD